MRHETLTWSEWEEKFRPIDNPYTKKIGNERCYQFETYGQDYDFVQAQIEGNYVWTNVQGDMCDLIINGHAYVNRLEYYVCEVPYEDDVDYEVIISTEQECTCYNEDEDVMETRGGEYGDPDCKECEGYGLVTVYND